MEPFRTEVFFMPARIGQVVQVFQLPILPRDLPEGPGFAA